MERVNFWPTDTNKGKKSKTLSFLKILSLNLGKQFFILIFVSGNINLKFAKKFFP